MFQEAIKQMAKCIKLPEAEIRHMSKAQLKMQKDMEVLIKKTVKKASKSVLKATDKLTKSNDVLQQAASTVQKMDVDLAKFEGIVNLQRAQYKEIHKIVEVAKFEVVLEVVESQANNIEDLKVSIKTI